MDSKNTDIVVNYSRSTITSHPEDKYTREYHDNLKSHHTFLPAQNIDKEILKTLEYFGHQMLLYGYDVLTGWACKVSKAAYVCPSVIVEVQTSADGKSIHVDTGIRMMAIFRTRCVNPNYKALCYSQKSNKIVLFGPKFSLAMRRRNRYTAWHLPIENIDRINE